MKALLFALLSINISLAGGDLTGNGGGPPKHLLHLSQENHLEDIVDVTIKDVGVVTIDDLIDARMIQEVGPYGEFLIDQSLEIVDYRTDDGVIHQMEQVYQNMNEYHQGDLIQYHMP